MSKRIVTGGLSENLTTQRVELEGTREYEAHQIKGGNSVIIVRNDYANVRVWINGRNDFGTAMELTQNFRGRRWNFTDPDGNPKTFGAFYVWTEGTSETPIVFEVNSDGDGIDYYLGNSSSTEAYIDSIGSTAQQQLESIGRKIPNEANLHDLHNKLVMDKLNFCYAGSTLYNQALAELAALEAEYEDSCNAIPAFLQKVIDLTPNPNNHPTIYLGLASYKAKATREYRGWYARKMQLPHEINTQFMGQVAIPRNSLIPSNKYVASASACFGSNVISDFNYYYISYAYNPSNGQFYVNNNKQSSLYDIEQWVFLNRNGKIMLSRRYINYASHCTYLPNETTPGGFPEFMSCYLDSTAEEVMNNYPIESVMSNYNPLKWDESEELIEYAANNLFNKRSPQVILADIAAKQAEIARIQSAETNIIMSHRNYSHAQLFNLQLDTTRGFVCNVPSQTNQGIPSVICYLIAQLQNVTDKDLLVKFTAGLYANSQMDLNKFAIARASIEFIDNDGYEKMSELIDTINATRIPSFANMRKTSINYKVGTSTTQNHELIGDVNIPGDLIAITDMKGNSNLDNVSIVKNIGAGANIGICLTLEVIQNATQTIPADTPQPEPMVLNAKAVLEATLIGETSPSDTIKAGGGL